MKDRQEDILINEETTSQQSEYFFFSWLDWFHSPQIMAVDLIYYNQINAKEDSKTTLDIEEDF